MVKLDNTNRYGVKLGFKITNPNIMGVINHRLEIREMIGEKHFNEMKEYIESQANEAELVKFLQTPVGLYTEPTKEPPASTLRAIVDKFGIIIDEKWEFKHEAMDDQGRGVINERILSCYPMYVRANQQIAEKEGKTAEDDIGRNVTGQVSSKSSKSGTYTDAEITVGIAQSADAVMKELLGPASHDLVAKKEMKAQIYRTGNAKLKDLTNDSENKKSLIYFDHMMKALGIDTDLVEPVLHK